MRRGLRALAVLAMIAPAAADALTVFDVTGSGTLCTYSPDGVCAYDNITVTGTITIHVNPADSVSGSIVTDGATYAFYSEEYVTATYDLKWDGGSFTSRMIPGAFLNDAAMGVYDNYGGTFDQLRNEAVSHYYDASTREYSSNAVFLIRQTPDLTWVNGLLFPETLGLAPEGFPSPNLLAFEDMGYRDNDGAYPTNWHGFSGDIQLQTMTIRTVGALLDRLKSDVWGLGSGKSLANKVALAQTCYAVPDIQATCAVLADFNREVSALAGKKKLTAPQASDLTSDANEIMAAIGCE